MKTNKIELKVLVDSSHKTHVVLAMIILFCVLYFTVGIFHLGTPAYLSLFQFEENIPLVPWTIWIYAGLYPLLVWLAFSFHDLENLNRLTYAFATILFFSTVIYFIFPVAYPREYYPLAPLNDASHFLFRLIRSLDRPVNCLPSLHVGCIFLMSFGIYHENRNKFYFGIISSVAISISTLTTKQHYFVDILAGFMLALILYLIFWKKVSFKRSSHLFKE